MIGGILASGRRMAESLMDDTVTVTTAGAKVWDESVGDFVTTRVPVYTGMARLRMPRAFGNVFDAQGDAVTVQEATLSLPVDGTASVAVGDLAELTASKHDAGMVGTVVRITHPHSQTHSTARRFGVEVES